MADSGQDIQKMTSEMRYYYRNREEKIAKDLSRYHNKPEVIAKREERERKRAEKEAEKEAKKQAEKEAKRIEKERIRQEKLALAEATKRKFKEKSEGVLDAFLTDSPPAVINRD
jgi:hypothetical protein